MAIKPAYRIQNVKEYYFSRKLKEIARMNAEGRDVINLGIGNPDQPPALEVTGVLNHESAKPGSHGYQSYVGIPELRKGFSDWYKTYFNVELDPDKEILPLIGSKEGIMHISMAFINPGDGVLVPNPGYPTYKSVSNLVGAEIISYELKEELGWQPDFDELEKLDYSRIKMMWVNYPNMPTGARASKALFKKLIAFGKEKNILICNDNPYSFILNNEPLSILETEGAKEIAIELNSLSKSHNMAGWRIGMLASNEEFVNYILRVKSNMDSGMFKPLQKAAAQALSLPGDWYSEVNEVYKVRKVLALKILTQLGCTFDPDQAGMFVWAKIPDAYANSEELSEKILQEASVFITPGFIFGSAGEKYIRISLCTKEELLEKSLERIKKIQQ